VLNKQKIFLIAITYTFFVYVICLLPIQNTIKAPIGNVDKLVHLAIYFIFTLVWFAFFNGLVFSGNIFKSIIKSSVFAFFTGVIIEILQHTISKGRSADVNDVLANTLGILIAIFFLYKLKRQKNLKSNK
jgi:VanZ family protein